MRPWVKRLQSQDCSCKAGKRLHAAPAHRQSTRVPRRVRRCLFMSSSMSAFSRSASTTIAFPPALSFARHCTQPEQALALAPQHRGEIIARVDSA